MVCCNLVSDSNCPWLLPTNRNCSNPLHLSIDEHYTAFVFYRSDAGDLQQQFFMHIYEDFSADIGPDERRRINRSDLTHLFVSHSSLVVF